VQVIPKAGHEVTVLLGPHAGRTAVVTAVRKDQYKVELALPSGETVLEEYEHVSKKAA
jgi:transcription antitermination factor NusG